MANRFIIPPINSLVNGDTYILYITTYESNTGGVLASPFISDGKVIQCNTTPSFQLDKYSSNGYTLTATSLELGITYSQAENVELNEFYIEVMNSSNVVIYTSNLIYDESQKVNIDGLVNHQTYHAVAHGTVVGGMKVTSSTLDIFTDFIENTSSNTLEATNNSKEACVDITSIMDVIRYESTSYLSYIDNTKVNLSNNQITYNDGLTIPDNFSFFTKYTCTSDNTLVLSMNNGLVRLLFKSTKQIINGNTVYSPFFEFWTGDLVKVIHFQDLAATGENVPIPQYNYKIALNRINKIFTINITA